MPFLNRKLGIDFSAYIADRTLNFTGREWVFEEIQKWLANAEGDRFFLLTGEPGSGKTAIAARLTQFSQGTETYPGLEAGFLHAVHFCSARDSLSGMFSKREKNNAKPESLIASHFQPLFLTRFQQV